jgi:hypothetical protein
MGFAPRPRPPAGSSRAPLSAPRRRAPLASAQRRRGEDPRRAAVESQVASPAPPAPQSPAQLAEGVRLAMQRRRGLLAGRWASHR